MSEVIIYHNPRCSKSRQTLALLEENGVQPEIRKYLDDAPSSSELALVIEKLNISPRELLRNKEAEYKENGLDDMSLSDEQIIQIIERPIVIKGNDARIGRPPESVLEII